MEQYTEKFFRKKTINNKEYQINVLGAMEALKMGRTLSKVILPAVAGILDGTRANEFGETPKTFTDLALMICTQLDDLDFDYIVLTLLKGCKCDGRDIQSVDTHFQGDLGEMISVLEFALRENFSSFFTGNDLIIQLRDKIQDLTDTTSNESQEK